ncbi:CHAD domain-containing protein [Nocardioides marmoriginsengisoli]|uniref:CHAD domain-containing protein n=1 Tax=Nocardioides marmoriginsengisoli TaxID=661483 RepID=UPI003CCC6E35
MSRVPLGRLVEDQVVAVRAAVAELRVDLGAVHDARVALRRLRATLTVFRPVLADLPPELGTDLRWFARQLAATRDAEVAGERLGGRLEAAEERAAAVVLADHLACWADEAAAAAGAALADERTDLLLLALGRLHLQVPTAPQIYLDLEIRRLAMRTLDDLCADLPAALATDLPPGRRARLLHDQRKQVKVARAVTGVLDVAAEQRSGLDKAMRSVQELLGEHHDAVVAREWMTLVAIREPATADLVRRLRREERAGMVAVEEKLVPAVDRLVARAGAIRTAT